MNRTILHCDLNGFYASVECLLNPSLVNIPMAVAGNPENRHGIILAKNELAKKYGVKTAETIGQAKRKCPNLTLTAPHHELYGKYSRLVNEIYRDFTDLVEPFGIDESWLDVTGVTHLFGSGEEIADKIRATVKEKLGLTISVGVSFNKVFAKLGSDYKKPDATTVIAKENYKEIIFPLPVSDLLYVGKVATETLKKHQIRTIGDLAKSDKEWIKASLGKMGALVHDYANGRDDSPVKAAIEERDLKSVGNGITFKRNLIGLEDIKIGVHLLADEVAGRMRASGVKCNTVSVTIKNPEFKSIVRQKTLETPTYLTKEITEISIELIKKSWNLKEPIRMLTITGMNLVDEKENNQQLSLFGQIENEKTEKQEKLESTIDSLRNRFGRDAVSFGSKMQNDLGLGNKH